MKYHVATATQTVWKPVTCEECGTRFEYAMTRSGQSNDGTMLDAIGGMGAQDAAAAARYELEYRLKNETELRPCPSCGLYQPDMAVPIVFKAAWVVPLLAVILLLLIVGLDAAIESVNLPAGPTLLAVIVIAAVAYLPMRSVCETLSDKATQLYYDSQNANRKQNIQKAADLIKRGKLRIGP